MEGWPAVIGTLVPIAGIALAAIAIWLGTRQKERETFHRTELLKKIAESQGDAAQRVLDMIHQQEKDAQIRKREGLRIGGLITLAVGIGLGIFLALIERQEAVWAVGLIPTLVGLALLVSSRFVAPGSN